jgi:hypothetical protein
MGFGCRTPKILNPAIYQKRAVEMANDRNLLRG